MILILFRVPLKLFNGIIYSLLANTDTDFKDFDLNFKI